MQPAHLLADPTSIRLEKIVQHSSSLTLVVEATRAQAECPRCHRPSSRLHSYYTRKGADLPWHGVAVRLHLRTRRFRCQNSLCTKRVFRERLPGVVATYGRKTVRLDDAPRLIGYLLGGEAGARATQKLAMATSPDTLLRRVRVAVKPCAPTPRVLGVDDFAFQRGQRYGTILVDMEKHRVIDLLADRESATLAAWLKAHPGVEVVSRDRSPTYAAAINEGAPAALQVADRFHLLMNVREAVEKVLMRQNRLLRSRSLAAPVSTAPSAGNDAYAGCRPRLPPHLERVKRPRRRRASPRLTVPSAREAAWMLPRPDDFQAVRAALEYEWSQGRVEGQVHRLKLVKRQLYGRGKLDLLRARVLHAA